VRGRLGSLALALVSLALACGAAELGLRLAGYTALYQVYSRPELFWRHDARLGWSLEPGARGRFVGPRPYPIEFDTEVSINSLGLRGPEPGPPAPGEQRVLVLGDSVVAGFEVEHSETFVARLEDTLQKRLEHPVRAINAGIRGYGTDQSLLWYRERGRALAPHVVVLVFSLNDFEDNVTLHRPRRPFGKGAFALRPNGALELVGVPVPPYPLCSSWQLGADYAPERVDGWFSRGACRLQTGLADRSALFTLAATTAARLPGLVPFLKRATEPEGGAPARAAALPWPPPRRAGATDGAPAADGPSRQQAELTSALVQALVREVRADGARFLLLITPRHWERLDVRALGADRIRPYTVAMPRGLEASELRFRNDGHFNRLGHRVYADGLAPLVEDALRARQRDEP
jgi:lysophospholipase L1-like esterase